MTSQNSWCLDTKTHSAKFLAILSVFALAFIGPATADESDTAPQADEQALDDSKEDLTYNGRTCFYLHSINGFNAIDNEHVYVSGGGKRQRYLLTTFNYCIGLRFTETIALNARITHRICDTNNDRLIVADHSHSRQSCLISDVERVADLKEAREIVAVRKEAKAEERARKKEEKRLRKLGKEAAALEGGTASIN